MIFKMLFDVNTDEMVKYLFASQTLKVHVFCPFRGVKIPYF